MFAQGALIALTIALLLALIYQPHTLVGHTAVLPFPPQRIVSLTLAADEILLALVPPERSERIVALTYLADDPRFSNVLAEAKSVGVKVRPNAERVIALQPDLVLFATYVSATAKSLLRETGIPFFELPSYTALAGVQQNILALGRAIGENERAHALATAMAEQIRTIQQQTAHRPRPRIVYYAGGNFVAGRGTSMDDIITHAGGQNIAAEAGIESFTKISQETLVTLNPAHIFVGGEESDEGLRNLLLADPTLQDIEAIRTGQVHILPPAYVHTLSHHMVKCVAAIARILHPEAFAAYPLSPRGRE
jgi:iron complex transport system substrate-binding protein